MLFKSFPKWLYHATEQPRIVSDHDERETLGDGWHESPVLVTLAAAAPEAAPVPAPEPKPKKRK